MKFVNDCDGRFTTEFRTEPGREGRRICMLLWGDQVREANQTSGNYSKVFARGRSNSGWVPTSHLCDSGLLEFYIIDVGQGDGVLIRTPDNKWHIIDGGVKNATQMLGKGAANFIRWKFREELRQEPAQIETVTISHPDFDHYGGLINLLSGDLEDGREEFQVTIGTVYHSGMGRFDDDQALGSKARGTVAGFPIGGQGIRKKDSYITELLDDLPTFDNPPRNLTTSFKELAYWIVEKATSAKRAGCKGAETTWFHDYSPTDNVRGPDGTKLTIKVLGPISEEFTPEGGGAVREGLRNLASDSKTRNGHSVILRFDYGDARILMTGDLNDESQRLLLSYIPAEEYSADVAKGCHHGSEDVNLDFLAAMQARATVISSGDNEDYSHPRPVVVGASGFYGRQIVTAGERHKVLPPLVYSTELARSTKLATVERVRVDHDQDPGTRMKSYPSDRAQVKPENDRYRWFSTSPISTNLIYGLVNVRTDGKRILCATLEEVGTEFDIKVFEAGNTP